MVWMMTPDEPGIGYLAPLINAKASARVPSLRRHPRMAEVMVTEPGFLTPRMVRQRCSASVTIRIPLGLIVRRRISAAWEVNISWVVGRRANDSMTRAKWEYPVILLFFK